MTKYCVESLIERAGTDDFELLILDNGSTDNRIQNLTNELPPVKYGNIELLDTNIGIAKGYNKLLQKAKGENIVFVTNDILVCENWLVDLIHWNEQVDKAGATSIHCEGVKGSFSPLLTKYDTFTRVWIPPTGIVFGITLVNRSTIEYIGKFDERLGIYGKEREQYWERLKLAGFNNFYVPEQYSIHLGRRANDSVDYKSIKEKSLQIASLKYNEYLGEIKKDKNFKI
jgi:GT2 family glycosyltransferase